MKLQEKRLTKKEADAFAKKLRDKLRISGYSAKNQILVKKIKGDWAVYSK